jgi:hypothetical protein
MPTTFNLSLFRVFFPPDCNFFLSLPEPFFLGVFSISPPDLCRWQGDEYPVEEGAVQGPGEGYPGEEGVVMGLC